MALHPVCEPSETLVIVVSTLPEIVNPLTLVAEFKMKDNRNFRHILNQLDLEQYGEYFLLNVSIVSWAGLNMNITTSEFEDWCHKYLSINWSAFLEPGQIAYFKRFVEQVFISIKFQQGSIQVLKEQDRVGDRGIIECSYFGASGYRFGR